MGRPGGECEAAGEGGRVTEAPARLAELGEEAAEALRPRLGGEAAVLLVGSAATEFADRYSGIDLAVVVPDREWGATAARLGWAEPPAPGSVRTLPLAGRRVKVAAWPLTALAERVRAADDQVLYALTTARVLHDPGGIVPPLLRQAREVPPEVWRAKADEAYRQFRQRKASLAWALRRGQPFLCLDNLMQVLTAALCLCYYLEGRPPANRKWLFRGALRTAAGQALRPLLLELFSSLGDIALLGGSFSMRRNRLYRLLSALQRELEGRLAAGKGGRR